MSTPIQQSVLNKARNDKFLLVLNLPNILKSVNKNSLSARASEYLNQNSLQYSVYGTTTPNLAIADINIPFGGQVPKISSLTRPAYEPITVNFSVDNHYNNWWVLWYWMALINDPLKGYYNANNLEGETLPRDLKTYTTDITIFGLDEYNNKIIQFDYTQAFITGLGNLNYNYQNGEMLDSTFTFAFGQMDVKLL